MYIYKIMCIHTSTVYPDLCWLMQIRAFRVFQESLHSYLPDPSSKLRPRERRAAPLRHRVAIAAVGRPRRVRATHTNTSQRTNQHKSCWIRVCIDCHSAAGGGRRRRSVCLYVAFSLFVRFARGKTYSLVEMVHQTCLLKCRYITISMKKHVILYKECLCKTCHRFVSIMKTTKK